MTEKPEVEDKHKEIAKEMMKEYDEDRPTVTMPGSGGTVAGTAVADWLDDDGNPKYSDESKDEDDSKDDAEGASKDDSADDSRDEGASKDDSTDDSKDDSKDDG